MGKRIDLTGQRFGRLVVISFAGRNKQNYAMWNCTCDCGGHITTRGADLRNGSTTSCGCSRKSINATHGQSGTRLYHVWLSMVQRTCNPNDKAYHNYGGRGITVCEEWRNDFATFQNWALSNGYRQGLSIDRIDNDGDYSPVNCRWASHKEQSQNTRRNHLLTFKGETKTLGEWAAYAGIGRGTLVTRLKLGWSIEKALETPVKKKTKHK